MGQASRCGELAVTLSNHTLGQTRLSDCRQSSLGVSLDRRQSPPEQQRARRPTHGGESWSETSACLGRRHAALRADLVFTRLCFPPKPQLRRSVGDWVSASWVSRRREGETWGFCPSWRLLCKCYKGEKYRLENVTT